jgi:hypothetical protein
MADQVYMGPDPWAALAGQHSDIRREGYEGCEDCEHLCVVIVETYKYL